MITTVPTRAIVRHHQAADAAENNIACEHLLTGEGKRLPVSSDFPKRATSTKGVLSVP
jgi:hypothetical protein